MAKKSLKEAYLKLKNKLLTNKLICEDNKKLYHKFLEFEEYKLKRKNGLSILDESTYITLYGYIQKINNVNKWFNNKPLKKITKSDIKKVYDGLEDGTIKNKSGKKFKDLVSYYNKIFKSKLFNLVGKDDLAREVIEFTTRNNEEVRFITEDDFRKLTEATNNKTHKLLLWLSWDIGENINALLQLKKSDFYLQKNVYTKEDEFRVNLRRDILKRSRKARSEITNYNESVKLLKDYLKELNDDDLLFNFDYRNSKKIIDRLVKKTKLKTIPNNQKVSWKDLRSGMACDLLKKGWTTDEVNARLGHRPSSSEIDKYVNFLALDRRTPKKKIHKFEIEKLGFQMEEMKRNEKLNAKRYELKINEEREHRELIEKQMKDMQKKMEKMMKLQEINTKIKRKN
jgi:hypothetical protein